MSPKVSIILLNWNGAEDTLECLSSLKLIDYDNYEIIVVDNNSSDPDFEIIQNRSGDSIDKIIRNDKNLGFAGGNNVGIQYALENGAEFIMLLNNDTVVEKDFLSNLINDCDDYLQTGLYTPMINYFSNKNIIWSAGGYISKIKASGFSSGTNRNDIEFSENSYCTFASGCCMLIRREVFEKIGLLNENYFLYLEDTDFCYRITNAGYKILYVGSSKIYHKVSSTTSKSNSLLPLYFSLRNRLYFAKNNLGIYYYLTVIYLVAVFIFKLIFVFKFSKKSVLVIFNSIKDFVSGNMGKGSMSNQVG